jgi:hypothetical protein
LVLPQTNKGPRFECQSHQSLAAAVLPLLHRRLSVVREPLSVPLVLVLVAVVVVVLVVVVMVAVVVVVVLAGVEGR